MPSPALNQDHLRALRARLDQLGYMGDHFGSESVTLVQRLLSDLVQTTEACRQLKVERDRLGGEKAAVEKKILPLRQEVSHLTADNNALHLKLISQIEERDERERAVQIMVKRHQNEVTELKFLNSQYLHKIKVEQRKVEQERARVEDWLRQQGVFAAMSKGKAVKADQVMHKMQRIEMETVLEPMETTDAPQFPEPDPHVFDIVKLCEARVKTVEQQCRDLEAANADLEAQIQAMQSNISLRDQEIARLGEQLEQSRSSVVGTSATVRSPTKDAQLRSPSRSPSPYAVGPVQRVEQLESQLAYIQDHAADLEQRARKSDSEKEALRQEWQAEREGLTDRLRRAQEKNDALVRELDVLESLVNEFEMMREGSATKPMLGLGTLDPVANSLDVQGKPVETAEQESSSASEVGKCSSKKKRLKELRELRRLGEVQSPERPTSPVAEKADTNPTSPGERVSDPSANEMLLLKKSVEQFQKEKCDLERSLGEQRASAAQHARERAESKRQLADVRSQLRKLSAGLEVAEREKNDFVNRLADIKGQAEAATKERDNLIGVLETFENQFVGLEDDIRAIAAERDNIRQLYEQTLKELRAARQAINRQGAVAGVSAAPEGSKKGEESMLKVELRQLKSELGEANRRYESLQQDNAKFVTTTEQTLRNVREERDSAQAKVTELTYDFSVAREKINQYEKEIEIAKHDAEERKEMAEQMKILVDRLNSELQLQKEEVSRKTSEIENLDVKLHANEAELVDIHQKHAAQFQALEEQKVAVRKVDADRDQLHAELDAKTEKVLEMGEMVQNFRQRIKELESELAAERNQEGLLNQTIGDLDREIASLRRQLDELVIDRDTTFAENERYAAENRNLGTDLEAVTSENQILNSELAEAVAERDRNLAEAAEKEEQVKYLEDVILTKEQEREQLMASYRKLINENERLENGWKATSDDTKELRMEIIVKENKIQSLQKAMNEQAAILRQYNVDFQAYEKQANQLTRTLAALERELRLCEDSKQKMSREISAARELAASIDRVKEDLQKQVTTAAVEREKLRSAACVLESEKETILAQLRAEKAKYEKLEQVIAFERTEKYHSSLRQQTPRSIPVLQ